MLCMYTYICDNTIFLPSRSLSLKSFFFRFLLLPHLKKKMCVSCSLRVVFRHRMATRGTWWKRRGFSDGWRSFRGTTRLRNPGR